jgi:NADH-quinone oxidoreductase subunit N
LIENLIYSSPIITLVCGLLFLCFLHRFDKERRKCFRLCKLTILTGFCLTVIFYNKTAFPELARPNLFTLLFQIMMYLTALATFYLSRKWYYNMNESGYLFCGGLLISLIAGNLLTSSVNLGLTTLAIGLLLTGNYFLLKHADKKKEIYTSRQIYAVVATIVYTLLLATTLIFYYRTQDLSYETLQTYLAENASNSATFCLASLLIFAFIFLLGAAPLHYWFTETMGQIILPVLTYFILVPVCPVIGAFIRLHTLLLSPLNNLFYIFFAGISFLSIGIGALGACSGKNLRKIFAYSSVYHLGIVILMFQNFSYTSVQSAFVYLFVYLLAMYGICASLFGIKSKGEYLFMLSDFEGVSYKRPYISAMLTVFLFSLIGFPPFLGFVGELTILNNLAQNGHLYQMMYLFAAMVVIAYAYLQIIKTIYFTDNHTPFDRADTGIYIAVLIDLLIMSALILQPLYFAQDLDFMLGAMWE